MRYPVHIHRFSDMPRTIRQISFDEEVVKKERDEALDWLTGNGDGYPLSWAEEEKVHAKANYEKYDDEYAPAIIGYEQLEYEGLV